MSLFAGSEMCKSENEGGLMPEGAEWMTRKELQQAWMGKKFSLGWWVVNEKAINNANGREIEPPSHRESIGNRGGIEELQLTDDALDRTTSRFGIDVGSPVSLGFRQRRGWRERVKPSQRGANSA